MTAFSDPELSSLALSLAASRGVHLSLVGRELIMEGSVPSYEAKRKIESMARSLGLAVRNCIRVTPGAESELMRQAA
jgi:hypothetical protein